MSALPARGRDKLEAVRSDPRAAWVDEHGQPTDPLAYLNLRDFEKAGLRVQRILRLGAQQTRWVATVQARDGTSYEVRLGTTADLTSRTKFRRAVYEVTGEWLPRGVSDEAWGQLTRAIHAAAELADHDSTDADQTRAWIADYLQHHGEPETVDTSDTQAFARALGMPDGDYKHGWRRDAFTDQHGVLHLRIEPLLRYVTRNLARTTRTDLAANLGALGFKNVQLSVRHGGRVPKGRFWTSPPGFDPEEADVP